MLAPPGQQPVTGLIVAYDGDVVIRARFTPHQLTRRLDGADADLARLVATRTEVADTVAGAFQEGRYRTPEDRAHVATLLLWLACRGDRMTAERTRAGGVSLAWRVTSRSDGAPWPLEFAVVDGLGLVMPGEAVGAGAGVLHAKPTGRAGHGEKFQVALAALRARGELPAGLRRKEWERRVIDELRRMGFAASEMPARRTIDRHWAAYRNGAE